MIKRIFIAAALAMSVAAMPSCGGKNESTADSKEEGLEWGQLPYQDEYGKPTGKFCIATIIDGSFSNSATTDSKLAVAIVLQPDSVISIKMAEYGSLVVKDIKVEGKMRGGNGEECPISFRINDEGIGSLFPAFPTDKKCIEMLTSGKEVDILLRKDTDYGVTSKYYFTIPANSGIKKEFDKMQSK